MRYIKYYLIFFFNKMTSLYDKFHSDININHIYNLIDSIIKKQTNESILNNIQYLNHYNNQLREIFIKSNETTIEGLNKEVVSYHIKYFLDKINKKEQQFDTSNNHVLNRPSNLPSTNEKDKDKESVDVMSRYNEFVQSRDMLNGVKKNIEVKLDDQIKPEESVKELSFQDLINKTNSIEKVTYIEPVQEPVIDNKASDKVTHIVPAQENKEIEKKITISSANRSNPNSNRFNYKVKNNNEINKLQKLIIPIEQSIHFSSPILKVKIPEFNFETELICKTTYKLNNYTIGIYEPEENTINSNKITDEITIQIQSLYDDSEYEPDIIKCKIDDNKLFVGDNCDYKQNDILCIQSNDKKEFQKIIEIEDSKLEMECIDTEEEEVHVMNMNLQNNLIFII